MRKLRAGFSLVGRVAVSKMNVHETRHIEWVFAVLVGLRGAWRIDGVQTPKPARNGFLDEPEFRRASGSEIFSTRGQSWQLSRGAENSELGPELFRGRFRSY